MSGITKSPIDLGKCFPYHNTTNVLIDETKNLWRLATPLATPLQIFKKFDYPFKNPRSAPVLKLVILKKFYGARDESRNFHTLVKIFVATQQEGREWKVSFSKRRLVLFVIIIVLNNFRNHNLIL